MATDRIYVKPATGVRVRDPHSKQHLPEAGQWVTLDTFWRRRMLDGDLLECEPPPEAATTTPGEKRK